MPQSTRLQAIDVIARLGKSSLSPAASLPSPHRNPGRPISGIPDISDRAAWPSGGPLQEGGDALLGLKDLLDGGAEREPDVAVRVRAELRARGDGDVRPPKELRRKLPRVDARARRPGEDVEAASRRVRHVEA